jgi:hypothetical protein
MADTLELKQFGRPEKPHHKGYSSWRLARKDNREAVFPDDDFLLGHWALITSGHKLIIADRLGCCLMLYIQAGSSTVMRQRLLEHADARMVR